MSTRKLRIKWNDTATVTPSNNGWAIYDYHWRQYGLEPPPHEETLRRQLWELANIFGDSMFNGCDNPFESTFIELETEGEEHG